MVVIWRTIMNSTKAIKKLFCCKRQQVIIFAAAGVILGGFMLLQFFPLRKKMAAIRKAEAAQNLVISKVSSQSRHEPLLKERLLRLEMQTSRYDLQVPYASDLGGFLREIAGIMNEHNLKEQMVQPGKQNKTAGSSQEITGQNIRAIPVTMACKGSLGQVFEFFKSLQNLDRLVSIEQVKLVNDKDFNSEVSIEAKTVIYYRPQAEQG